MKISFWNVQRLGAATAPVRRKAIDSFLTGAKPDVRLYCELLPGTPGALPWTYRKKTTQSLAYGCETSLGVVGPTEFTPNKKPAYAGLAFKGGNNFAQLAIRKPGHLTLPDGVDVYFLHAPASGPRATKVVAFMLCDLLERHPAPGRFILVGDLNVSPAVFKAALHARAPAASPLVTGNFIRRSGHATHHGRRALRGGGSELDWALSNFPVTVSRRAAPRRYSDHDAIVLSY